MALEDLTGNKYISDLVSANPVESPTADDRGDGDDHVRGVKNVSVKSFPNMNAAYTGNEVSLNLLAGETSIPSTFAADTGVIFRASAAPTGWTQETALASLDGSTIRMTTGTGGGAVGGSHSLESAPSMDHSHADTLVGDTFAVAASHFASHFHYSVSTSTGSGSPDLGTSEYIRRTSQTGTTKGYDLDSDSGTAAVGRTASSGTGTGHTHTITGSVSSATLTEFAPKYTNVILCIKD